MDNVASCMMAEPIMGGKLPNSRTAVCECSAAVTDLLLVIIIVGAGQQVAKDELGHVHILLLMHLHRHAIAIVPDADRVNVLH